MHSMTTIPVVPLRGGAVFPGVTTTISIGRRRSLAAAQSAAKGDGKILILVQYNSEIENPTESDLTSIGILAKVRDVLRAPQVGGVQMLVELNDRVQFTGIVSTDPFLIGTYTDIDNQQVPITDGHVQLMAEAIAHLENYADTLGEVNQQVLTATRSRRSVGDLADYLAGLLNLPFEFELDLFTELDGRARLEKIKNFLEQELRIAQIRTELEGEAREGANKAQREFLLREQMKAIKRELGEDVESGDEELKKKIDAAGMPEEVEKKALKELKRLSSQNPQSAEAGVIRTYLETLADLPWNKSSEDLLDLAHVRTILDEDHYGLEDVKDRIVEFVAVRKLAGNKMRGAIINLNGPPGVGKTSIAQSVARAMGREMARISLGGVRDEAEIRGHRRTYIGALPGRLIRALRDVQTNNPVIVLDEIDKVGSDWRGDPSSALLEVLDPEQNSNFTDHYLEVPFDLSQIIFITTSNDASRIPAPLFDRMESIDMPGYIEDEKLAIAIQHLVRKQLSGHGIVDVEVSFKDDALLKMVRRYTREAGVRQFERLIGTLTRKVAVKVANGKSGPFEITTEDVREHLGPEKFSFGIAEEIDEVGVSTGLAVSRVGGDILSIEVSLSQGTGKVLLTGSLGDVMRESARAALTYARSHADDLGLDVAIFDQADIHIHVPDGATPKDGPSAGIALGTAIISALTNRPVRHNVAMTGEVTLRGKVLEIGGLKGKTIAAHRAGISTVLLPKDNAKDIPELPEQIREDVDLIPVSHLSEVIDLALLPAVGPAFKISEQNKQGEGSDLPLPNGQQPAENQISFKKKKTK